MRGNGYYWCKLHDKWEIWEWSNKEYEKGWWTFGGGEVSDFEDTDFYQIDNNRIICPHELLPLLPDKK